jgi:hypothetical protein
MAAERVEGVKKHNANKTVYPSCEQKQKLLVNVLYRPDMIFVSLNIRLVPEAPAAGNTTVNIDYSI